VSGENKFVVAYRRKLLSLAEGPLAKLDDLNDELDKEIRRRSSQPPRDPRRDDDDEQIHDVVDLAEEDDDEP
jgi:hypothetical protein